MSVEVETGADVGELRSAQEPQRDEAVSVPGHGLLQAIQSLVTIIVVALFIITFTVQPFRIPSESMEPTLLVGDFLLVNKQIDAASPLHLFGGRAHNAQERQSVVFLAQVGHERGLQRRVAHLVNAQCAEERVLTQFLDQR